MWLRRKLHPAGKGDVGVEPVELWLHLSMNHGSAFSVPSKHSTAGTSFS